MRAKTVKGPVDPSLAFVDSSEEGLKSLWRAWYPGGAGPTGAQRTICALIESICTSPWI